MNKINIYFSGDSNIKLDVNSSGMGEKSIDEQQADDFKYWLARQHDNYCKINLSSGRSIIILKQNILYVEFI